MVGRRLDVRVHMYGGLACWSLRRATEARGGRAGLRGGHGGLVLLLLLLVPGESGITPWSRRVKLEAHMEKSATRGVEFLPSVSSATSASLRNFRPPTLRFGPPRNAISAGILRTPRKRRPNTLYGARKTIRPGAQLSVSKFNDPVSLSCFRTKENQRTAFTTPEALYNMFWWL